MTTKDIVVAIALTPFLLVGGTGAAVMFLYLWSFFALVVLLGCSKLVRWSWAAEKLEAALGAMCPPDRP